MKRTKMAKLLSIVLSIVMMLGMMQFSVLAEDVIYEADFNSAETQDARASHVPFSNSKETCRSAQNSITLYLPVSRRITYSFRPIDLKSPLM